MNEDEEMLAVVANLYYKLNQSQAQIADRLGVSSSKVSRMIKEARARGIVDIQIRTSIPRAFFLEQELINRFGLSDAYVLQAQSEINEEGLLRGAGEIAASYLRRIIPTLATGSSIGVAWGTGVHATVSALPNNASQHIDVVQLMGGVGALMVDGPDLSRMVAVKLGGRHYDLHAPVLVEKPEVRDIFLSEPVVRDAIQRARDVQLAITGIGAVEDGASSFLRSGLLTRNDLAHLRSIGAVGEMVGRFFDADGKYEHIDINQRIIGIELGDLRRIQEVLVVARGLSKAHSILAALRANYITVLATDDATAQAILDCADAPTKQHPYHIQ